MLNRIFDSIGAGILAGMTYHEFKSLAVAGVVMVVLLMVFNLDRYITDKRIKESKQ
jgi:hypothetical protein